MHAGLYVPGVCGCEQGGRCIEGYLSQCRPAVDLLGWHGRTLWAVAYQQLERFSKVVDRRPVATVEYWIPFPEPMKPSPETTRTSKSKDTTLCK